MPKLTPDAVIIGSGFSGIVAARRLAESNLNVVLLDENLHVGGQLLRQIPLRLGRDRAAHPDVVKKIGFALLDQIKQQRIRVMNRTRVLGIYPGKEMLIEQEEKQTQVIRPQLILLASGARERFLPFPGWTLPGVLSTGALQVLIKSSGVLPARELLIGGSGLFLLAVAYEALCHGARVHAVLEQTPFWEKAALLPQLIHQWPKFSEGARFLARVYGSGVPVRYRTRIIEARGNGELQEVVVGRVNREGRTMGGRERVIRSRALAVGYGFTPNIELAQLAGCQIKHDADKGGWVVQVRENLETSVAGIFAAGEVTGIAGALKSLNEGEIAALAILYRLGRVSESAYRVRLDRLNRQRAHHLRFGRYFNSLYRLPAQAYLDIPDETVVCRCEDVTAGEIRQAVAAGYDKPGSLKLAGRCAMGDCQGRTCAPIIYDLLAAQTGRPAADQSPFVVRPPIKPAAIDSLASLDN